MAETVRRYVLFDFDLGKLVTTRVYFDQAEAADDAVRFDSVIVVPRILDRVDVIGQDPEAA